MPLRYQLFVALQNRRLFTVMLMFVMINSLFPIVFKGQPDPELIYPIISICMVLAIHFSWDELFEDDYNNGLLEQFCVKSRQPLWLLVLRQIVNHWLVYGVSLSFVAPVLAVMMGYQLSNLAFLFLSSLVLTFFLVFLGGLGSVLTLSRREVNILVPVLIIPLVIPVLVLADLIVRGPDFYWKAGLLFVLLLSNIPILVVATVKAIRLVVAFG